MVVKFKMKKVKAGIITIVDLTNYGNRLQNYAVSKVLKQMGIEAETIHVIECNKKEKWKFVIKKRLKNLPLITELLMNIKKNNSAKELRYLNFDRFSRKNIKMRYVYSADLNKITKECSDFKYFVIGSDQIWNPKYGYAKEFDFASFANAEKKICFSPSFGIDVIPDKDVDVVKKGLEGFKYISVRENSGADIVKKLTGKEAEVLIDPTMMLDATDWESVARKPKNVDTQKKYILSYFLGKRTEAQEEKINAIQEKNSMQEYLLLEPSKKELYATGPSEFIELVKNAELVCTDSFHACVFSILFRKPFIVFHRDGNGAGISSRLDTLLETFKLTSRKEENILEENVFDCDFTESYIVLEKERERVKQFISKCINS